MSSDSIEIDNLLMSDSEHEEALSKYTNSQLEYITDYNNSSYNGSIFFDTQSALNKWIVWADAYITIPLQISSSGTAYTAASFLAFKQSILSFITGLVINTSSGQTITNDSNISIINNIRLFLETSRDWYEAEGLSIQFTKDAYNNLSSGVGAGSQAQTLGGLVPTPVVGNNQGFLNRVVALKTQSQQVGSVATIGCLLKVPLRYVSSLFAHMDYPAINNRFQLTFNYATSSSSLLPFTADQTGGSVTPSPAWSIASVFGQGNCRLYYKSVQFSPQLNQKLLAKLQSGYTKKVYFATTDTYLPSGANMVNSTGNITNYLVSSSTIRPLRMFLVGVPTGGYSTATVLPTANCLWTQANVQINNTNYFQNSLQTMDLYEMLKSQFPAHGSVNEGGLISYNDYLTGYGITCFDLSRVHERLSSPNEAVSIILTAQRNDAALAGSDYYICCERLNCCTFHYSTSEVKVVVGLN